MTDEQLEKLISEEFEKFKRENDIAQCSCCKHYVDMELLYKAWQAAALPLMKKIEELKSRNELNGIICECVTGCDCIEKLQKENEELKKKAQMNIHNSAFTGLLVENEELRKALNKVTMEGIVENWTLGNYNCEKELREIRTKFNLDKEGEK